MKYTYTILYYPPPPERREREINKFALPLFRGHVKYRNVETKAEATSVVPFKVESEIANPTKQQLVEMINRPDLNLDPDRVCLFMTEQPLPEDQKL